MRESTRRTLPPLPIVRPHPSQTGVDFQAVCGARIRFRQRFEQRSSASLALVGSIIPADRAQVGPWAHVCRKSATCSGSAREVPKHSVYGSVMFRIPNHHMQMRVSGTRTRILGDDRSRNGNTRERDPCRGTKPPRAAERTRPRTLRRCRRRATATSILARFSRREALRGLRAVAALATLAPVGGAVFARNVRAGGAPPLDFTEVPHGNTETHAVADGYRAQTLIRWGDPVEPGAPAFDPLGQTAAAQAKQWGYNNDFVAWMPLPAGSDSAGRGLLCVNFEYTEAHLMFSGLRAGDVEKVTRQQVDTELAAHGHGIVEIRRDDRPAPGRWSATAPTTGGSPRSRRSAASPGPRPATLGCARTATPPALGSSAPWPIVPAARRRGARS